LGWVGAGLIGAFADDFVDDGSAEFECRVGGMGRLADGILAKDNLFSADVRSQGLSHVADLAAQPAEPTFAG
jgi:hypothetical protein